jgi:DNA-binding NarL/FixJ family response regulator
MSFEEAVEYALPKQIPVTPASPAPDQSSAVKQSSTFNAWDREVAAMVVRGMSNRQIAQLLYLSERTIENHVSKILRRLEVASRTEIAAWATEQRLIAPNPIRKTPPSPSAPGSLSLQPNASSESRK